MTLEMLPLKFTFKSPSIEETSLKHFFDYSGETQRSIFFFLNIFLVHLVPSCYIIIRKVDLVCELCNKNVDKITTPFKEYILVSRPYISLFFSENYSHRGVLARFCTEDSNLESSPTHDLKKYDQHHCSMN